MNVATRTRLEVVPSSRHIGAEIRGIDLRATLDRDAIGDIYQAWLDHVVRAGKTFRYTAAGTPEGLLAGKNKKVLAIIASGGGYAEGSSLSALDHEVPYLMS